jgi:DNA-binding FrmR family transcriptional regulator
MGHIAQEKQKLLNRIRRLRGQLDAIERSVEQESSCVDILQQITACRGSTRIPPKRSAMPASN